MVLHCCGFRYPWIAPAISQAVGCKVQLPRHITDNLTLKEKDEIAHIVQVYIDIVGVANRCLFISCDEAYTGDNYHDILWPEGMFKYDTSTEPFPSPYKGPEDASGVYYFRSRNLAAGIDSTDPAATIARLLRDKERLEQRVDNQVQELDEKEEALQEMFNNSADLPDALMLMRRAGEIQEAAQHQVLQLTERVAELEAELS
jgi:hypothetical protein